MNLFAKYGIKEVANVIFYSITKIGDEEFYTPALFFDALKISSIEEKSETATADGGIGNRRILSWDYGKKISVSIEDALFTPASMNLIWGGIFNYELSIYSSLLMKLHINQKYTSLNYSLCAYEPPVLSKEELELFYSICTAAALSSGSGKENDSDYLLSDEGDNEYIRENQTLIKKKYYKRLLTNEQYELLMEYIISLLNSLNQINYLQSSTNPVYTLDRMELCCVTEEEGFTINCNKQKESLKKYLTNDISESFVLYYDYKTMRPLFNIKSDDDEFPTGSFTLKRGTKYYKRSRTILTNPNLTLGTELTIDASTFTKEFKVVGETYARRQQDGKDQRLQFTIDHVKLAPNAKLDLKADGGPQVYDFKLESICPTEKDDIIKIVQYNVEDDLLNGGKKIIPQSKEYTNTFVKTVNKATLDYANEKYY